MRCPFHVIESVCDSDSAAAAKAESLILICDRASGRLSVLDTGSMYENTTLLVSDLHSLHNTKESVCGPS